ncbi:MAG: tRNA pseudouridine(38-40) synthase TruA [Candidatus Moeniiplasma glomeromycotorum]|nr:tRNA pseudouridine(38-40) synthase TruA [Candidatus Moeniiplasma glomeromycotorum]MCE8162178.1 tRNA pseudouridine(38-40) synthase TruA [Candidatus Moeniiplasma glomeromycotorum]MCE8166166.1 tRNA pseudouridine(38-40) synthase TruA [Candidatus Moeniiplasma glomeromycotorum]MCE8166577.1 tRNA pseudouridine(38-40) synthase TruA [Candidatus Moeniiplasma glomeromycotorum]
MYFYLVSVAYDGSEFAGWARQTHKFTVQGYIETALSKIFQQKIDILAASRTDKGVHAHDQNFTFRLDLPFSEKKLLNLLKKALKKHLLVHRVKKVSSNFHPIRSVVRKEYRYFINTQSYNIFQKKYCWEYNLPLETKKLNQILRIFQGTHNFFNYVFCPYKDKEKVNTRREIFTFRSWKRKGVVIIKVVARHFLRYQIRALVGEAINCYEGKQATADLQTKLDNFNQINYKYKNIAPGAGLYLWKITY